ncbi:PREDICTED: E3 ubiquitin-protein ligase RAD18 [Nanorana parkeri]|uniref:E3 ubiquitin-protein ligase RAD18 n=1 Tax=Nanorana parkeri TaxID=125878 RepID=UPI000854125B|nr:PREDICTED: E3 ubiquitin-protein ligase RAD18 [Nanorana parkeri]
MTTAAEGAPGGQPANPLQALDDLLHCGICLDYFNIAMIIPQCSHNYCSLCIRKFLSYKTQCPTCFVTVAEPDLRNNRRLDDLVQAFLTTRKHLSQHAGSPPSSSQNPLKGKLAKGCSGKKIKQEGSSMERFLVKNAGRSKGTLDITIEESLDSNLPAEPISAKKIKQEPEDSVPEYSASQEPSTSLSQVSIKLECPVCGVGIPEQYINKHLDSCLTRDDKKESLRSAGQKRRPITKVVYNLLSERDLRKRMKEVGLSTQGTKQHLIRRHQEFVHMYNAQCDSLNPKSAAEIIKEIEKSEKVRSSLEAKQESAMTFKKEQSEEEIDEIHHQYRNKHKSEFQQLVEQVKGRMKAGKKVKEEPVADNITDELDTKDTEDEERRTASEHGESLEESLQRTGNTSVVRSSSPTFPLSPDSRVRAALLCVFYSIGPEFSFKWTMSAISEQTTAQRGHMMASSV